MDKDICLHATYATSDTYSQITTIHILKKILKSKAVLSKRLQKQNDTVTGFNGLDYISLCDYSKKEEHYIRKYNAFEGYIRYSLSLIFPKEKLDIITPELIYIGQNENYDNKMKEYGLSKDIRYSDIPDEVQVKDSISLDLMTGITLPIDKMILPYMNSNKNTIIILKEIARIIKLLGKYNYNVPLYDIDTFTRVDDESNVKYLIKHK